MSSSMDKTIVIWSFDKEAGVWMDDVGINLANVDSLVKTRRFHFLGFSRCVLERWEEIPWGFMEEHLTRPLKRS